MEKPIIEFKNVDITNSDTLVIENLSFEIFQGDFVYLTGKVGSGKTSIIRTIIAENPVTDGEARVGEFNLKNIKRKQQNKTLNVILFLILLQDV